MLSLLKQLQADYPALTFEAAETFYWSPQDHTVYFAQSDEISDEWTLLHETSHGILGHTSFSSDFELLQLELAAWQKAKELAKKYDKNIDTNHVEDCLDTYRTWLYKRSLCPNCGLESPQKDEQTYSCINCSHSWRVSPNRLHRPYRVSQRTKKAKAASALSSQTAFAQSL